LAPFLGCYCCKAGWHALCSPHTVPTVCSMHCSWPCSVVEVQLAKLKEETRCPMCFGKNPQQPRSSGGGGSEETQEKGGRGEKRQAAGSCSTHVCLPSSHLEFSLSCGKPAPACAKRPSRVTALDPFASAGKIRSARISMVCLHRYCAKCIEQYLRAKMPGR
jgi:hypothetical protein